MRQRIIVKLLLGILLMLFLTPVAALAQVPEESTVGFFGWISLHWVDLLALFGGLVAVAGIVARLTPTSKDDEIVGWLAKLIDTLSPGGIQKGITRDSGDSDG